MRTPLVATLSALLFCLLLVPAFGDDWPRWMGPGGDNVWRESGVLSKFPKTGLKVVWRTPIAGGYSGPAVANGRVFITDYVTSDNVKVPNFERNQFSGVERVLCLEEGSGKLIWKHEYPVKYGISYPAGPRSTPVIDGDRVYTLGAEGKLICFDAAKGKEIWSLELKEAYQTKAALWGYASHPLIDGDNLICVVGGKGSHTVAFNKLTGNEVWRAGDAPEQGYSPPLIIEAGGVRQLISTRPNAVASLDPATGKQYWSIPYNASNGSIIMTPIRSDDLLYVAGYSNKSLMIRLADDKPAAEEVWANLSKQAISPVNVQPMLVGKTLYGFDQNGLLYGVDFATGKRLWQTGEPLKSKRPLGSGTAFIVRRQDHFWLFNEMGELIIADLTPEGYEEISRVKVIDPTNVAFGRDVVWSQPAFANRRVYVRNDKECICVDVAEGSYQQN